MTVVHNKDGSVECNVVPGLVNIDPCTVCKFQFSAGGSGGSSTTAALVSHNKNYTKHSSNIGERAIPLPGCMVAAYTEVLISRPRPLMEETGSIVNQINPIITYYL